MASSSFRRLDAVLVVQTVEKLRHRIGERFPDSGLRGVADALVSVASRARDTAPSLANPIWYLRLLVGFVGVLSVIAVVFAFTALRQAQLETGLGAALQAIEAGINNFVFLGIAFVYLLTLERKAKRGRALKAIHELRSLVHIVDMHQLTKDPEIVLEEHTPTASSPPRFRSRFELARYLDYCSEMLSLSGKVAALYVQYLDDPVVLSTVTEVETLVTGISSKIWQKIVILDTAGRAADRE